MDSFPFHFFDFSKPTSLYVHVPFCKSKCSYCAFYSVPCISKSEIDLYVERIVDEIDSLTEQIGGSRFHTAYIGGGNPGLLEPEHLLRIVDAVCKSGYPTEFTVEMNPESLSTEHFEVFRHGLTRLSMGLQCLTDRALRFLGRNSSLDETLRGADLSQKLREDTGCQLNYDVITCLPEWNDTKRDVERIVTKYSPEHISLYSLTLEEGTLLYRQRPSLPDSDAEADILLENWNLLEKFGYEHYEVSNFARICDKSPNVDDIITEGSIPPVGSANQSYRSLHNSAYWSYHQYVGIGAAAASTGFRDGRVVRVEGRGDYRAWRYESEVLTPDESLTEFVMLGLRQLAGLDLDRLKKDFGKTLDSASVPMGYCIVGHYLVPTETGFLTSDHAAFELLESLQDDSSS